MTSQIGIFFIYIIAGIAICVLFDIFRALRKAVKTSDLITYIEDVIFWILSAGILIYIIFIINNGILRAYTFIGLGIGILIYFSVISKYFIKVLTKILKVFLIPIKFVNHFMCINLQNGTKFFKKILNITKDKGFSEKM